MRHFNGVLAALALSGHALAQDLGIKAPPQDKIVFIFNAEIHPVAGEVIENGYITFEDGRITDVGRGGGPSFAPGTELELIDAGGKRVYPGLIGANTLTGLVEVNSVRATQDYSETGDIAPEVRAAVAVNPDSTIIPVTRKNGILTVGVLPMGGLIPGRASVIRMDGWTWEDLAVKDAAGLMVNWPSLRTISARWMTRSDSDQLEQARTRLRAIDDAFDAAAAYVAAREADPTLAEDLRWEAVRPVLAGEVPVFIRATEMEQIQSAVSWAVRRKLKAVIVGGHDAHLCAELLKKHDIGVIVTGTHRMPKRADSPYDEPFVLPRILEEQGVRWCLATGGGSFDAAHERNLPYHAATAVAFGLSEEAAIRAITLSAAELLGVGDRLGSLEVGKAATLIITDGSPLEVHTRVERAFIDGREISLENKQTALERKYREKYRQIRPAPAGNGSEQ